MVCTFSKIKASIWRKAINCLILRVNRFINFLLLWDNWMYVWKISLFFLKHCKISKILDHVKSIGIYHHIIINMLCVLFLENDVIADYLPKYQLHQSERWCLKSYFMRLTHIVIYKYLMTSIFPFYQFYLDNPGLLNHNLDYMELAHSNIVTLPVVNNVSQVTLKSFYHSRF